MSRWIFPGKAALQGAAFLLFLSGCVSPNLNDPATLQTWAAGHGFTSLPVHAHNFRLAAFSHTDTCRAQQLTIYIEGDGARWPTPFSPPDDPTPRKPTAWLMAMQDTSAAVVYLGRPCQYLDAAELRLCDSAYWTERRFAPEVVDAYIEALDQIKSHCQAETLRLVGYSGGGAIAALLAARRNDVSSLVTVAAPLALSDWVTLHNASPLTGSLDPAMEPGHRPAESVHFAGTQDRIVPARIVEKYIGRRGGKLIVVSGFDHDCCWVRDWAILLDRLSPRRTE